MIFYVFLFYVIINTCQKDIDKLHLLYRDRPAKSQEYRGYKIEEETSATIDRLLPERTGGLFYYHHHSCQQKYIIFTNEHSSPNPPVSSYVYFNDMGSSMSGQVLGMFRMAGFKINICFGLEPKITVRRGGSLLCLFWILFCNFFLISAQLLSVTVIFSHFAVPVTQQR